MMYSSPISVFPHVSVSKSFSTFSSSRASHLIQASVKSFPFPVLEYDNINCSFLIHILHILGDMCRLKNMKF
ncbi:unnamed protein product [Acanthoscelides obtectus]|uniref:Uncharacterized protein n=1 Tax=Acanthoscelides obtectus TaxID=200917 RepID=A0A9P0KGB1_ACAOB|nr:unnamed protein product [Acanthoscelides obtectus]CAK1664829.1 hypothetical protein AOBTE_LOCUS24492 [Acanthoscelides obtectus]